MRNKAEAADIARELYDSHDTPEYDRPDAQDAQDYFNEAMEYGLPFIIDEHEAAEYAGNATMHASRYGFLEE